MKPVVLIFRCIGGPNPAKTPEKITNSIGDTTRLRFSETCYLCDSSEQAYLALEKVAAVLDVEDEYFIFPVGPEVIYACSSATSEKLNQMDLTFYRVPSAIGRKSDQLSPLRGET